MTVLYSFGIALYSMLIWLVSPFNAKAVFLYKGRREAKKRLAGLRLEGDVLWIHAASLGEFEQGRPIIEALKKQHPHYTVVLSFFSPSGYELRKNYALADHVLYLPADTAANARLWLRAINPTKVIFIKYEFWYHYLMALKKVKVPVYGVSTIFRADQAFFKWYGGWFRRMLKVFTKFYVQDQDSANLLSGIEISSVEVAGDTRFDRVKDIAAASAEVELAKEFVKGAKKVIVAGSTWEPDEDILVDYVKDQSDVRLIIAPHEIHDGHVRQIEEKFGALAVRFTEAGSSVGEYRVLIVNTMGMLSAIYKYGHVAYVGGGFGVGIHNILEAATYGMPVFFGPKYKKFKEARDLIALEGAFSINNYQSFEQGITRLWEDAEKMEASSKAALKYVESMCGATEIIMREVFGKA